MKLWKCANNCCQCLLFSTPDFEIFPPFMGLIMGVEVHTNGGNPKGKLRMSVSPGFALHSVLLFPQIPNTKPNQCIQRSVKWISRCLINALHALKPLQNLWLSEGGNRERKWLLFILLPLPCTLGRAPEVCVYDVCASCFHVFTCVAPFGHSIIPWAFPGIPSFPRMTHNCSHSE